MDYKFQYTVIKKLVSFYNTTPANKSSLIQDILNNKDLNLLNDICISIFTTTIDANNTCENIFDLVDLGIFESHLSYSSRDWINSINVVHYFNDNLFALSELKDVEYVAINNVVMNGKDNDLVADYESITKSQKLFSGSKSDLIDKYELVHEFIFLSFTISCYRNFLLLDKTDYKEFENLLELNLFKWTSSFNEEMKEVDSLLELQEQCRMLEHESNKNSVGNDLHTDKNAALSALVYEKENGLNELSNILSEIESKENLSEKLKNKYRLLARQYKTLIDTLPAISEADDSDLHRLLATLPSNLTPETSIDSLKRLEAALSQISSFLNNSISSENDSGLELEKLNSILTEQTNTIRSLKQQQNEKLTQESKKQLLKQSQDFESETLKKNILREYSLIKVLEKQMVSGIVTLYKNLLKIDLKKYTSKFEEMENAVKSMDSEFNDIF